MYWLVRIKLLKCSLVQGKTKTKKSSVGSKITDKKGKIIIKFFIVLLKVLNVYFKNFINIIDLFE